MLSPVYYYYEQTEIQMKKNDLAESSVLSALYEPRLPAGRNRSEQVGPGRKASYLVIPKKVYAVTHFTA